ncbi:WecB/TagA/CpsF family glycosyltransferase [Geodermatophilus sp. YIM 151500]|uniref:WecB/TagA/CpsF family glycosyltransferase n=1 Tax=Geodermatophilus sp. YIM 151500 TaxID=2984531 RepID=UPI0021E3ED4E|nr:WecB/TagA/CpsF family glycosyltransferase [Geodermatophilus sp. YIM 151500]MCV2491134.1 WecB/TagA/CpsF family glycosyltransferase [Geodermatophilus sp. YIM 151500]
MSSLGLPVVRVAGIDLVDADLPAVLATLAVVRDRPVIAYALHVGSLNAAGDVDVRRAYATGDLTYADGVAVVLVGRAAGGRSLGRAPTTDLAPALLRIRRAAGPVRVFLLGGPPGLAAAAGRRLAEDLGVTVVGVAGGYGLDKAALVRALHDTRPDVVLVGMGSPLEVHLLAELRPYLPTALYLTCGGWFGFLAGHETRAPVLLQRCGLEWTARLAQAPRRLLPRYLQGAWTTARLLTAVLRDGTGARPRTVST